jgi:hypothetical protein
VIDDALWPNGRGSYMVDDEGVPGQRTVLVDGGYLKSYILDRQSAFLLNQKSTGNGRRMSYRQWPLPRMTNTYIDRGTDDPASLLSGITKGFYAAELGGGSVDTTSGNFNFAVQLGYLIENGQKTKPVRGAVLIGNSSRPCSASRVRTDLQVDQTRGMREGRPDGAGRRGSPRSASPRSRSEARRSSMPISRPQEVLNSVRQTGSVRRGRGRDVLRVRPLRRGAVSGGRVELLSSPPSRGSGCGSCATRRWASSTRRT